MATEAQNLRPPPFPLCDLGPCELSWSSPTEDLFSPKENWVFWSRHNDELLRYHHQRPLLYASNNGDPTMKEKIKCALQGIDPYFFCKPHLIQFWGLVDIGDSMYLTTCDQPFALGNEKEDVKRLSRYRKHCLEYLIAVDETSVQEGELGPPGRVFRSGLPEYIFDVSYYSSKEYPQRDLAVKYLKSYHAFPVYQSPGGICVGVLEFVSPQIEYIRSGKVVDLLKVGLTTNSPVSLSDYEQSCLCHKTEINKIAKVLGIICKMHRRPVARMWIEANSKQLTAMFEGSCYGRYAEQFKFDFCFIRKGHGVVGKAFSSQGVCFCKDIRQLSMTEYPFVAHARQFGFSSCFAICLQSSCSNSCIYTLEFLLPTNKTSSRDHRILLPMIMKKLKRHLQTSFKVASGQELGQNLFVEVIKVTSGDDELDSFEIRYATNGESTLGVVEEQNEVGMTSLDASFQQVEAANNSVHDINVQQNVIVRLPPTPELVQKVVSITHPQQIEELDLAIPARDDASIEHNGNEVTNLRKRGSTYTLESALQITLEILEQHSALKRKDAAQALQISESTLKRICRGHGIPRWPPRKARECNQVIDQQEFAQSPKENIGTHAMSVATRLPDDSSIMVKNVVSTRHRQPIEKFDAAIPARDDASMEHDGNARDDANMEHNGNEATNLRKRTSDYPLESELGITLEVLEQYSALKVADVAKAFGVSRSTFKRMCRRYHIHRWPPRKARKYNQAIDQQEIAQPSKKNIGERPMSVATRLQDDSSIMVKATYGDVKIKFELSLPAQKMDLDEQVATRLKLPVGSFKIMYLDEEDDWVLITCDKDLSISLRMLRSPSMTTIRMLVSQ